LEFYSIDTGKTGAIVHFKNSEPIAAYAIPYISQKFINVRTFANLKNIPIYIEDIHAFPGQSSKTTAIQFTGYGGIVAAAFFVSDKVELIHFSSWMAFARKQLYYEPRSKFSKDDSRALASKLWPGFCDIMITGRKKKLPDGIADALCLGACVIHRNKDPKRV